MSAERIDAHQAHEDVGAGALLVCAYDDGAKFRKNHLDGALSLSDLQAQEGSMAKDREIVFYCA